jgi:hypothetical protein
LGRVRSADDDCSARLRRCSGVAGLDSGDEQSLAALSGRAVATNHPNTTCDRLLDFQSTRHHRLHGGGRRLRHRSPCDQDPNRGVSGARRCAMALRPASTECAPKGRRFPKSCVQIVQETFRRKIKDFAQSSQRISGKAFRLQPLQPLCSFCELQEILAIACDEALKTRQRLARLTTRPNGSTTRLGNEAHVKPQSGHGNHRRTIEPAGPLSQQCGDGRPDRKPRVNM